MAAIPLARPFIHLPHCGSGPDTEVMNAFTNCDILLTAGASNFEVLLIPVFLALTVWGFVWHFSRSRSILENWADQNGYQILERDYRNFFKGPFFWVCSRQQTVYHVKVRDREGRVRSGWVRCGGWFTGLWSDKAEVRWED